MVQVRGDLDLLQEPLGSEGGRKLRPKDLHRDLPLVLQILGEINSRHTTGADFSLDGVAVGEG